MDDLRLLYLAHIFPPAGGGGVQRTAKFVKFLQRHGWKVTVVTTQEPLYGTLQGTHDPSLLEEIPADVEVRRIESAERPAEPPRGLFAPGRAGFERWFASLAPEHVARGWPEPARFFRRWWWARSGPDPSFGWAEGVVRELAARGERWPLIFATGPPFSTLLAARALAQRWRVPFVADLRDPWCAAGTSIGARLFRHRRLEESVLRDAARALVVTDGMRDLYGRSYPEFSGRLVVIENGVDLEEPWRREPIPPRGDRFDVVYTGVLTEALSPEAFFRAARIACDRSPDLARQIRIVIAGRIGTTEFLERRHRAFAELCGLRDRLEERGYLPHDETVRLQRSAGALLSIVTGGTHIASGKTYEYLAAGRPILALIETGGAAMEILRHAPAVAFAHPNDPEAIAGELLRLHTGWKEGRFDDLRPSVPEHWTRASQARQLDSLLRSILGGAGTPPECANALSSPSRSRSSTANATSSAVEGPPSPAPTNAPTRSRLPPGLRSLLGRLLRRTTLLARPLARAWARPGYFSAAPPMDPPRSVAVVACHWIGDTLWSAQAIPALRSAWPHAEITIINKPLTADLWRGFVDPDRVVCAPEVTSDRHRERVSWTGIARRAATLRGRRFDLVLDLTGTRYSALFAFLLRPGWTLGFSGGELGWLFSASVPDDPHARWHLRERPFHVARRLLPGISLPPALTPPQPARSFAGACESLGLDPGRPVVVLVPGAGWPEKRWPLEVFVEIGRQLAASEAQDLPFGSPLAGGGAGARSTEAGAQIVIVGSAGERPLCERLRSALPESFAVVFAGAPLGEVCGLLSGATAVIGHDSGIVHLAAAYGRRALALYTGATDPTRSRPFGEYGVALRPGDPGADPAAIARWALEERPGERP